MTLGKWWSGSEIAPVLILMAVCGLAAALAFQRHFSVGKNYAYRRINWMIVCMALVSLEVVLLVHVVNLIGFETGNR